MHTSSDGGRFCEVSRTKTTPSFEERSRTVFTLKFGAVTAWLRDVALIYAAFKTVSLINFLMKT